MARISHIRTDDGTPDELHVVLSERNLIALLVKLHLPETNSLRALQVGDVDGRELAYLIAEPDEIHYANPQREGASAGDMHPLTEFISMVVREALERAGSGEPVWLWLRPDAEPEAP